MAKKQAEKRRKAVETIRRFIKGFMTRDGLETEINAAFIELGKKRWLMRLSKHLPPNLLSTYWLDCPHSCIEASKHLRGIHKTWMGRKYRKELSSIDKKQFELKILAETLFKDKKKSYQASFRPRFLNERFGNKFSELKNNFVNNILPAGENVMVGYFFKFVKYNLICYFIYLFIFVLVWHTCYQI